MMKEPHVTLTLRRYLELSRYVGQLEGSLIGARTVLHNNKDFNIEAIDELLEWPPDMAINVSVTED